MRELGVAIKLFGLVLALAAFSEDCHKYLRHQQKLDFSTQEESE